MMADTDIQQFLSGLQRAGGAQMERAKQGFDRFAVFVLGDAQDRCPVEFGDLKASATDRPAEVENGTVVKVVGFNKDYGAAVHENLTAHHDQGEAKFLELALRDNAPKCGPYVAAYVKAGGA